HLVVFSFPTRRSSDLLGETISLNSPLSMYFLGCSESAVILILIPWLILVTLSIGLVLPINQPAAHKLAHPSLLTSAFSPAIKGKDRKSTRLNSSHVSI